MTQREKGEHEKLVRELRELKKQYHELYCSHGNLRDAIQEIAFNWRQLKTLPTECQLNYLIEVLGEEYDWALLESL